MANVSFLSEKQWEFVYKLHCYGYTYKELAEWLNVYPGTVQYNVHRLGFKSYDREPLTSFNDKLQALGGDRNARS